MAAATVSKFLLVLYSKKKPPIWMAHCGTTFTFTFTPPMSVAAPKVFPLFWQHLDFTSVQVCWITFHHFYNDVGLLFIFWCWFIWELILTKSSFCPSAGVLTCHKVTVVILWYRTQNVFSQVGTPSPCVYLSSYRHHSHDKASGPLFFVYCKASTTGWWEQGQIRYKLRC